MQAESRTAIRLSVGIFQIFLTPWVVISSSYGNLLSTNEIYLFTFKFFNFFLVKCSKKSTTLRARVYRKKTNILNRIYAKNKQYYDKNKTLIYKINVVFSERSSKHRKLEYIANFFCNTHLRHYNCA